MSQDWITGGAVSGAAASVGIPEHVADVAASVKADVQRERGAPHQITSTLDMVERLAEAVYLLAVDAQATKETKA